MTQEEKAKRYDEVLEIAKKNYVTAQDLCEGSQMGVECFKNTLESIFPELKSEDERIRKALISILKSDFENDTTIHDISVGDIIAWLEKQGEKDKLIRELGEYKVKYIQETLGKALTMNNKDDERVRKTTIDFLKDFADKGYENAVECIDWLEKQKYALKSFKDEDVRKFMKYIEKQAKAYEFNLTNRSYDIFAFAKDILIWLEKQGEKPQGKSALEAIREEKVDNANKIEPKDYSSIDPYFGKPADKVNPKFHEGEWTVSKLDRTTRQISEVHFDEYNSYYVVDGIKFNLEDYDRRHHSWTIQDAKDGDVLATEDKNFTTPFVAIYKSIGDTVYDNITFNSHCFIGFDGNFYGGEEGHTIEDIHPATKEQRKLLSQRMKEAGYKWDAEKKELIKEEVK